VSESWQLLVTEAEMVAVLAELPVAVVVSVKLDDPLGLPMVTAELDGKALNKAAVRPTVVELPL
jgi:hypothetical protein